MHWRTRLLHSDEGQQHPYRSLSVPTYRGSTVVFESCAEIKSGWRQTETGYSYGIYGSPTVVELGRRIAELEGAFHSFILPGGQAAIALVSLSLARPGSHVLVPANAYGPHMELANGLLASMAVDVEVYDPLVGARVDALLRDNTALVWTESPGSITMEIQDVPAIVKAAHARGIPVAIDNTYSSGIYFDAFAHGVDISMQALTKYVGGHSDILLGSVSVRSAAEYEAIGPTWKQLGMGASPDDASLALRGMQTLAVRLDRLEASTLKVAEYLSRHPRIEKVLHPALPSCQGHELWKRDYTGSSSVFSMIFSEGTKGADIEIFVDALRLFKIGHSWGGTTSLVMIYPAYDRPNLGLDGRLVRLNVGLEEASDLIADLEQGLAALGPSKSAAIQAGDHSDHFGGEPGTVPPGRHPQ